MQEEISTRQDDLSAARVRLEAARTEELQRRSRQDLIVQQRNWQISQKTSLESEILQAEKENDQNISLLAQNSKEIEQTQEGLKTLIASLADLSLEDMQEQTTIWSTRSAVTTRALNDVRRQLAERQDAARRLQEQQTGIEKTLAEIAQSLTDLDLDRARLHDQTAGTNNQLDELRKLIEPTEKELEETEAQESDLQKQETEGQTVLARVERTYTQIQLDLGRKQEMLSNLRQKIEDDFGLVAFEYATDVSGPVPLPFDGMVEQLPAVAELPPDLEENMTRQRAQLRRMGAINPEAQQEYQSVKERHTFLTAQVEDLHKAEADLHQVIAELDELTRKEFHKTFDAVAEQFHTIFHRLFGGGVGPAGADRPRKPDRDRVSTSKRACPVGVNRDCRCSPAANAA